MSLAMIGAVVFGSAYEAAAVSGVANTYQAATVVGGVPDSSGLSSSDCALVIQMTGTIADGLGVYEILNPANATPTRTYSGTEAVQFVILPGGCGSAQTVDPGGVQAQPWDGSTGGVVFLGGTTLTMSDNIDVSGTGYADVAGLAPGAGSDGCVEPNSPGLIVPQYPGASGGGGIIGGGAGSPGPSNMNYEPGQNPNGIGTPGDGGTEASPGAAGLGGVDTFPDANPGCVGGAVGAPGNGTGTPDLGTADGDNWGSSSGGGSYGGGGSACASWFAAAYSSGGSGDFGGVCKVNSVVGRGDGELVSDRLPVDWSGEYWSQGWPLVCGLLGGW